MVLLMAFMLLARATDYPLFEIGSYLAAGALILVSWRQIALREIYLISVCTGLTAFAFLGLDKSWDVFESAIAQATFLMAFLLLVSLLHEAAITSPSVSQCGQYLTRQPPSRRYLAVFSGTNIMSVLFNLGIISLLTPLIKAGVEQEKTNLPIAKLRERRQLTAMLRGFAWGVVWSPTAIAPLAVMELIDGISRELWSLYGLGCTIAICIVGWAEDKWRFRQLRPAHAAKRILPPFPRGAMLRFVFILISLFSLTILISVLSDDSIVFGLMVSCPLVMLGWLLAQNYPQSGLLRAIGRQTATICFKQLPNNAKIMIALAASGYIGRIAAEMVPTQIISEMINRFPMPDFVFLLITTFIMIPFSYLGVSPIMMAVFFGSILGALPVLPVDPTLAALAISCGWALSMTTSPFATVVLMMSNLNGKPPLQLALGWNARFSLVAMGTLCVIFFILTGGQ